MQDAESYNRARKRVKELKEFYAHLGSYILVTGFLAALNFLTSDFPWVLCVILPWGLGLAFHAASVYAPNWFGEDWEERKTRELMAKESGERKAKNDYFDEDK